MKKSSIITLSLGLLLIIFSAGGADAQTWTKASNSSCYYYTNTSFTWDGGSLNGYCHGYGTIQWTDYLGNSLGKYVGSVRNGKNDGYGIQYYYNGNKAYSGYWKDDKRSGFGTSYRSNGDVFLSGNFANDAFYDLNTLDQQARTLTTDIVSRVFDGGKNVGYEVLTAVYGEYDNKIKELQVRITFNGDLDNSNKYECTAVLKEGNEKAYFVDCNPTARHYLNFKNWISAVVLVAKIFDAIDNK